MAVLQVGPRSFRGVAVRNGSSLACLLFVLAVLVAAFVDRSLPLAIYLLSFWHYVLYWLAFAFGTIAFDVFKRDAIAMKTVSVAALAFVYLRAPLDPASLDRHRRRHPVERPCRRGARASTAPTTVTRWPACRRAASPPFPIR